MIKGCNIIWGQKLANACSFVGGRIIAQQEKILRAERRWMNLLNVLQEVTHYTIVKFCIYCFSLWYKFFVHCTLRVKKIINMVLMQDLWNFGFFGGGDVSPTHSELCRFVLGSYTKHHASFLVTILLKKTFICIGHPDNILARCDSIFPLLRCQAQWNKTCTQLSFPNPLSQSKELQSWGHSKILLSFLMQFNGHF